MHMSITARDLYQELGVKSTFTLWWAELKKANNLKEDVDFVLIDSWLKRKDAYSWHSLPCTNFREIELLAHNHFKDKQPSSL